MTSLNTDKENKLKLCAVESKGYGIIAKIPMLDPKISPQAKAIYAYICSFAGRGDTAFPKITTMCEHLGMSKKTFLKHKQQLINRGYLDQYQEKSGNGKFKHNVYRIVKEIDNRVVNSSKNEKPSGKNYHPTEWQNLPHGKNYHPNNNKDLKDLNNNSVNNVVVNKPNAFTVFEQSGFGLLSGTIISNINNWIDDFKDKGSTEQEADELVSLALRKADENGVRKWNYAHKILLNWLNKGFTKPSDVEAHEKQREQKQGSQESKKDAPDFSWEDELDSL